jgi:hypothetical protein
VSVYDFFRVLELAPAVLILLIPFLFFSRARKEGAGSFLGMILVVFGLATLVMITAGTVWLLWGEEAPIWAIRAFVGAVLTIMVNTVVSIIYRFVAKKDTDFQ